MKVAKGWGVVKPLELLTLSKQGIRQEKARFVKTEWGRKWGGMNKRSGNQCLVKFACMCVEGVWGWGVSGATSETLMFGSHLSYSLSSATICHTGFVFSTALYNTYTILLYFSCVLYSIFVT